MGCSSSKAVLGQAVRREAEAGEARPPVDFVDRYQLGDVLGRGAYGTVHRACSVESNEDVAVKILDLHRGRQYPGWPRAVREDVGAEQRAWALVGGHPNVVGLREFYVDQTRAYFVMELCTNCLLTALKREPELNEYTYVRYFREMAQALAHIHSVGVVHRDVKQDNFMVGGPDGRTVKLCDFGSSGVMEGGQQLHGQKGTAPFMAPEMVIDDATHGPPADVWSLGVIVYIAFFGSWPYQPKKRTSEEMRKVIRQGIVPPNFAPPRRFLQNVVSEAGIRFVKALLDRSQVSRPTAAACLEMPYLDKKRCHQLQARDKTKRFLSLAPQLWAAIRLGAFSVRTPQALPGQERRVMTLQGAAQ